MTNAERDQVIMEQLNQGTSLSDVQKLLASEYGLRMTYFELRMLAADLQVDWSRQDKPKAEPPSPASPSPAEEVGEGQSVMDAAPAESAPSPAVSAAADDAPSAPEESGESAVSVKTEVTLDEVPMAGTAMSGSVTFASGAKGTWAYTRDGRMGFEPDEGSSEPTDEDYEGFQAELRKKLMGEDEPEDPNAGPTVVDVDAVVRPGVRVSGSVTFSSGAKGSWMLDMRGQLGFELAEGSPKPTRRDAVLFQRELREVLSRKGY